MWETRLVELVQELTLVVLGATLSVVAASPGMTPEELSAPVSETRPVELVTDVPLAVLEV